MENIFYKLLFCMCMAALMVACDSSQNQNGEVGTMNSNTPPASETTRQAMKVVKDARIFFAHKSVGNNILSGLKTLVAETGVELVIKDVTTEKVIGDKTFAHAQNGDNRNPVSKIEAFHTAINEFEGSHPQIAFMKFCYVDFTPDTDVKQLLTYYRNTMATMEKAWPEIIFVHLTVPLTARSNHWKSGIKRMLGLQTGSDASNIKRMEYNQLLLESFPRDHVFDIARIESTHPDGQRESFVENGKTVYSLAPEYTSDGGHLNALGQRRVATELLQFLAGILDNRHIRLKVQ